jgi:hypothetical protein
MNIGYMLRIRDAYRGSRIPDTGSRIRIPHPASKNLSIFKPKTDTKFSKMRSGMFPDPGSRLFSIPDPGVNKALDPGSGSSTLVSWRLL